MTPLRRRYIEDLQLKHFAPSTINVYVHAVSAFARHSGKSPEKLGFEHAREYPLYLTQACGPLARHLELSTGGLLGAIV